MAPITRARSQESTSEDLDSENPNPGVNDGTGEIEFDHSSFWKDNSIQVVLRVRPLSGNEISQQGHNKCIRPDSYQSLTWLGHPESRFTFDIVADEHVTQEKLFKVAGLAMVDNCMAGYNSCMFAYGQTGSGKTHTMLGDIENGTRRHNENCGMTPRVFEYLFQRIQKEKETRKEEKLQFTCKCSFLEIYNELIYDLLDPNSTNLQIREDLKKGVYVENLKEYEVSSAREAMQQLIEGAANRKVAATNMNRASSRSHSIFTCIIESKWEVQGLRHHRFARLNLVDLAGSERQKSSGAEGERLKEATNINKSLSTLGLVIMNLTVSNKKSVHVPYRDSKLTFLLQDSLGGNSKTTIIANISPSNCCALETLSTLKFAQRAKFIKNNAIVNEDASGDVITMRLQIQQLKKEVNELRGLGHTRGSNNAGFESPYMLKLDGGIHGNFSPLTLDKRLSQKKESEAALVAAIRREHEKEASLRAMHTAKRTAEELVTQREEEIKSLKMRLRFREEGIKRLQKVSSGKLSSESHLMAENQELRKEIENLKSQLDRNPEITRFAMENLHLTEELRRLKAFVEEGERERMNEHITVLQDKLLEALDWKLMNEKDPFFGRENSFLLEPPSNEENEFLQLQAIQKEHEIELLRKKLNLAVQEKENLQRNVEELASQLENEKSAQISKQEEESNTEQIDAETELKTLVAAIANASQREAEAHETAISLTKENESLRLQLHAIAENSSDKDENIMRENEELRLQMHAIVENSRGKEKERLEMLQAYDELMEKYENAMREKEELRLQIVAIMENSGGGEKENLGVQLSEMHQENDQLMLMYENAMIEREEAKRLVREFEERNEELRELVQEKENLVRESQVRENLMPVEMEVDRETGMDLDGLVETVRVVRDKLGLVHDKLGCTDRVVNHLGLTEKAFSEIDELSRSIRSSRENVQPNLVQLAQYNNVLSEKQRKKNKVEKWFSVHVTELETSNSKTSSLAEKVTRIEAKINEVRKSNDRKSDEIESLVKSKDEINSAYRRARENEAKLWGKIDNLKASISDAECLKKEREKVLLEVNSMKALDLMKSEMERNKLSLEIKNFKEQLRLTKKEISSLTKSKDEVDSKVKALEEEIRVGSLYVEEGKTEIAEIGKKMEMMRITGEDLKGKMERMLPEYFKAVFDVELKVEEIKACEESVRVERRELVELEEKLNSVLERMRGLLCERQSLVPVNGTESGTVCVAEIVSKRIEEVRVLVNEAKELSLVGTTGLINVT